MMKRTIMNLASKCLIGILGIATLAGTASCDKSESLLGQISVTVTAPAEHAVDLSTVKVTVLNTADQSVTELTADANGLVTFSDVVAGTYNVSASATIGETDFTAVSNGAVVLSKQTTEVKLALEAAQSSKNLVIKEVFYSGENIFTYDPAYTMGTMNKDQFIEIFNNSDEPVSLDGLYIGEAWTPSTYDMESAPQYGMLEDPSLDHDYVYLNNVVRVPANAGITLQPGKSFLLATNAINFNKEMRDAYAALETPVDESLISHIIDLSVADMETYAVAWMQSQGKEGNEYFDLDNPDVPNADNIYMTNDYFYLDPTGSAPVIFRSEKEISKDDIYTYKYVSPSHVEKNQEIQLIKIPTTAVIDGADFVNNSGAARWKRIPSLIDKGFGFIPNDDGGLTNFSQRRKIDEAKTKAAGRLVLMDTNNSSSDFEPVDPPTPKGGYEGYVIK